MASASYTTGTNDYLSGFLPRLDLTWGTVGLSVAETALGSGKYTSDLSTAIDNIYYRLLLKNANCIC